MSAMQIRRASSKSIGWRDCSRIYQKEALEILESKKNGKYNVIEIDPDYVPAPVERKQVFGVTFEQGRNNLAINRELLENIADD